MFTVNLNAPRENTQLYFVQSQNVQSGRNHSNDFLQPLNNVKKMRTLWAVLILALKSHVPGNLSILEWLVSLRSGLNFRSSDY